MRRVCRWLTAFVIALMVPGVVSAGFGFGPAAASPATIDVSRPLAIPVSDDPEWLGMLKDDLLGYPSQSDPPPGFENVQRTDLRTDQRNQGTGLFDRVEYRLSGSGGQGAIEFRIYMGDEEAAADFRRLAAGEGTRLFGDEQAPPDFNARYLHGSRMFTKDDPEIGEMEVRVECALTLLPGKGLITRCAALDPELPVIAVVRRLDPEPPALRESDFDAHIVRVAPVVGWSLDVLLWIGW